MGTRRVILVDDEPGLLRAWTRLFTLRGVEVLAALPRVAELRSTIAELRPGVVVMDLSMPGEQPLEQLRALSGDFPDVRFLAYSGSNDESTIRAVHAAGASGYIDKLAPPESMFAALERVSAGERVFPQWLQSTVNG